MSPTLLDKETIGRYVRHQLLQEYTRLCMHSGYQTLAWHVEGILAKLEAGGHLSRYSREIALADHRQQSAVI